MTRNTQTQGTGKKEDRRVRRTKKMLTQALTKLIERGMREGVLRKGDPSLTAALIQSAVAGVDMGCCFDGLLDTESEKVQEALCGIILRGICADAISNS